MWWRTESWRYAYRTQTKHSKLNQTLLIPTPCRWKELEALMEDNEQDTEVTVPTARMLPLEPELGYRCAAVQASRGNQVLWKHF